MSNVFNFDSNEPHAKTHVNGARAIKISEDGEGTPYEECPICYEALRPTDVAVGLRPDKEEVQMIKEWVEMDGVVERCNVRASKDTTWRHYIMPQDINTDTGEIIEAINIIMWIDFSDMKKEVDKSQWSGT